MFSVFNPSKCTYTWSSGQPTQRRRGAVGGSVPCSRVSPQSNSCRSRDSNPQPRITSVWSSRLEIGKAHFQKGSVFINKLLYLSFQQLHSRLKYTHPVRHGESDVDTLLLTYQEEPKQPRHPIAGLPLLEFSPALES